MNNTIGLSVCQLRKLEGAACKLGLSERLLIENASSNLTKIIEELSLGIKVLVVCGKGNNAADVLACGRKLLAKGYDVSVALVTEVGLNTETEFQLSILKKLKAPLILIDINTACDFQKLAGDRDFILDGILGVGIKGKISTPFKEIIALVNESGKTVVSCDIPSGLSPDDGNILSDCIRAAYTITFIAPKLGFFLASGPQVCGKIFVTDIGVSKEQLETYV